VEKWRIHMQIWISQSVPCLFFSVCVISVNKYVVSLAMIASGLLDVWIEGIVDQLIF
jgi:hypothetical protein